MKHWREKNAARDYPMRYLAGGPAGERAIEQDVHVETSVQGAIIGALSRTVGRDADVVAHLVGIERDMVEAILVALAEAGQILRAGNLYKRA